jgi:hypothetical protein
MVLGVNVAVVVHENSGRSSWSSGVVSWPSSASVVDSVMSYRGIVDSVMSCQGVVDYCHVMPRSCHLLNWCPFVLHCALLSVTYPGGVLAANAFCAVRPPGHHAGPRGVVSSKKDRTGSHGFCLLNNVAIAAAYAMNVHRSDPRPRGMQLVVLGAVCVCCRCNTCLSDSCIS